ncbi:hypothetical protein C0993_004975 [Termitomyces sp. T159_Od127]|nr:hypothetical protein C0993_004975 [Termitomyces sp. T159_Od127]
MAGSNSSCSPSSSAVTIPIAGKSILKRSAPVHASLFSRIARFLPTQSPSAPSSDDSKPLKRAHFILPEIAIVYPISSVNPPSTPALKEEKKAIEDREFERRRRVVRGGAAGPGTADTDDWWSLDKVESFYRECCVQCDEQPDLGITAAFKNASPTNPRAVDFSGVRLTVTSASILSDVFSIEWGLRKLVFRECDLDEHILKPLLHSLLIPESLSFLSLASNRKLKSPGFRLVGAYVAQARNLQFLDLSQNNLDKKSVEYIVAALATAPNPGLVSLRIDDCQLRPAPLETLSRAVRTSSLRNISLRHNRINATGAVALALMIRDYPDVVPGVISPPPSSASSPSSSTTSLPTTPTSPTYPQSAPARPGPVLPPPRHPAQNVQTTYTPYIPRARRTAPPRTPNSGHHTHTHAPPPPPPLSATGQPVPIITSSSQGGVTTRHMNPLPGSALEGHSRHEAGPSAALLDRVRALDALPRLGALRTLDLKGNDLRTGITYIAQVLKRNRTLKVLNLSENKLDVMCLATVAEALKYNSCLETLDLSKNPCSGPGLEGIQSLRTAFTLNNALKRLFLSSTSLTSAGAIALAEFLPESTSLLHLDLTLNNLDIAAVMALSSGLKANHVMRCLDLNIPPGDEVFAKEILNSCVRNTEEAERNSPATASGRGLGKGVWGMIEESELAKSIRLGEEKDQHTEVDIAVRARECLGRLTEALQPPSAAAKAKSPFSGLTSQPSVVAELSKDARAIVAELAAVIQSTEDPGVMEELLSVNDRLTALLRDLPAPVRPVLTLQGLGIRVDGGGDPGSGAGEGREGGTAPNGRGGANGDARGLELELEFEGGSAPAPATPRADKGKGRAEPEPEEHEKVLSPTSVLAASAVEGDSEDEDDEDALVVYAPVSTVSASPNDRSRSWVAEEGEVFRKGTVLLGPEEMEGEYAGEELRKELLEAMVERPPPRPLHGQDEFLDMPAPGERNDEPAAPASPGDAKLSPRAYVSRRPSNSAILGVLSPALPV